MPFRSVATLVLLGAAALPAAAVELIEMKDGKLYEASEALVMGDKLRISLLMPQGQTAVFTVPIDRVLPEQVYYTWAGQIAEADVAGHVKLAEWCRGQGLFRQAWREYAAAAEADEAFRAKLPALESEMGEEAATWHFVEAERALKEGETVRARKLAERLLADYPQSKEVARTEGLLLLIADREKFESQEKQEKLRAQRVLRQRRELEKHLRDIDGAKTSLRNTRMQYFDDARRRLRWSSYTFRRSLHRVQDMAPFLEAEDLRTIADAVIRDTEKHMISSFTRLADLRYLAGDVPGALEAAHEVLWVDPDNKAMTDLRTRVLDDSRYSHFRFRYGYYDRWIWRRYGYCPPFAVPYHHAYPGSGGFGISLAPGFRRSSVCLDGGATLIRYVR